MTNPDWTDAQTVLSALRTPSGLKAFVETGGIEAALAQGDIDLPDTFDNRSEQAIETLLYSLWILQNETHIAIKDGVELQRRLDLRIERITYLKIIMVLAAYLTKIRGLQAFGDKLIEAYGKIPDTILGGLKETVRAIAVGRRADFGLYDLAMSSSERAIRDTGVFHDISHIDLAAAFGVPEDVIRYREKDIEALIRDLRP